MDVTDMPLKVFPFLSTPSARRATPRQHHIHDGCGISIHALREEGDQLPTRQHKTIRLFLSTPSARRATTSAEDLGVTQEFLSTPSARRATRRCFLYFPITEISIHALREEGDGRTSRRGRKERYFYPRPPRGGRLDVYASSSAENLFLSTPSARRATDVTQLVEQVK